MGRGLDPNVTVTPNAIVSRAGGTARFVGAVPGTGDDPRFVLEPQQGQLLQFDSKPDVPGVTAAAGGYTYISSILGDTAGDTVLLSGLITSQGDVQFVLIWNGTGELDGQVITGVGTGVTTPDAQKQPPIRSSCRAPSR